MAHSLFLFDVAALSAILCSRKEADDFSGLPNITGPGLKADPLPTLASKSGATHGLW